MRMLMFNDLLHSDGVTEVLKARQARRGWLSIQRRCREAFWSAVALYR